MPPRPPLPWRLDTGNTQRPVLDELPRPKVPLEELLAADGPMDRPWLLTGTPTQRRDLPHLVAGRTQPVWVDVQRPAQRLVGPLARLGVGGVRLAVHAPRADAHDWLLGDPGSLRRTLGGSQAAQRAGLGVHWRCTLTRPGLPYSARFATRMGVS